MKFSVAAVAGLLSSALAHPELLSRSEMQRRSAISKRCEASAENFNRRRMAKRWAGNTTYQIQTEAPYYQSIQNDTCVLTPTVTGGPYIWPRSQTLRQDMSENQAGVPLWMDIGVLDVNTCEPLPNVLVNLWHCNATGSYSSFTGLSPNTPFEELLEQLGVSIEDLINGTVTLSTDNTTFLRGQWPTNADGIMEMKTIFPGFMSNAPSIFMLRYTPIGLYMKMELCLPAMSYRRDSFSSRRLCRRRLWHWNPIPYTPKLSGRPTT